MKCIKFVFLLMMLSFSTPNDESDLFKKIGDQEIITKRYLAGQIKLDLSKYTKTFWGTGMAMEANIFQIGIIQGRKNDTLFEIVIIFKNNIYMTAMEYPNSTFYKKSGGYIRKYILGDAYVDTDIPDSLCFRVHYLKFIPILDTLENMFSWEQATILSHDSITYCASSTADPVKKNENSTFQ